MPYKSVDVSNTTQYLLAAAGNSQERVRLTGGTLVSANTVTVQFQSANTALTGNMTLIAGTPLVFPSSPGSPGSGRRYGYLQTNAGDPLNLVLGGNTQVSGTLEFVYVAE